MLPVSIHFVIPSMHRSLSDHDEGEATITRRRSDEMLKDDELTLAVIRNIASLSSNSATGIVIVGGLVSCKSRFPL